jgi:ferredoxin
MKVRIDDERCTGHGRCYSLAPDLLESDDEGFVTIAGGDPIELSDDQRELADELAQRVAGKPLSFGPLIGAIERALG